MYTYGKKSSCTLIDVLSVEQFKQARDKVISYDVLGDIGCMDENVDTQILNIKDFKNQ